MKSQIIMKINMCSDAITQDLVVEKKRTTGYSSRVLFFETVINI